MPAHYDVFISHASEDKTAVALPLTLALQAAGLTVWLDKFELTLGDSLARKIDEGLSRSRFGIVVLSRSFFAKQWPRRELDALMEKESHGRKVILPVWYDINAETIAIYSPLLASRLAVEWEDGGAVAVAMILGVIFGEKEISEQVLGEETVAKANRRRTPKKRPKNQPSPESQPSPPESQPSPKSQSPPRGGTFVASAAGVGVFLLSLGLAYVILVLLAAAGLVTFGAGRFLGPAQLLLALIIISPFVTAITYGLVVSLGDGDGALFGCGCLVFVLGGGGAAGVALALYADPSLVKITVSSGIPRTLLFFGLGTLSTLLGLSTLAAKSAFEGTRDWWKRPR